MVHNKEAIVIVIVIVIIIVKNSWHGSDTLAREIFTLG
jgi:hypothetical protein